MYYLGEYYQDIDNYEEMKKYYLMAINYNCANSMNNLGVYYKNIENNYDEMKKYYTMLLKSANIERECIICNDHKQMYYTSCNKHYMCNDCSILLFDKPCSYCYQYF